MQLHDLVLEGELLLFETLDTQRVAAGGDKRLDRMVVICVLKLETCSLEAQFGLFLIVILAVAQLTGVPRTAWRFISACATHVCE